MCDKVPKKPVLPSKPQEVNLTETLKIERRKYLLYKTLLDTILQCTEESTTLESETSKKLQNMITGEDAAEAVPLESKSTNSNITLLGLKSLPKEELKHVDVLILKYVVEGKLQSNYEVITKKLRNYSENDVHPDIENKLIFDYNMQLQKQRKLCAENLKSGAEHLRVLQNLRFKELPIVFETKVNSCELAIQVLQKKFLLLKNKCCVDVFMETEKSLEAYTELMKDIERQKEKCQAEINNLKYLREKYKQVRCSEYDAILKSYRQCKLSYERKKFLLEQLKRD